MEIWKDVAGYDDYYQASSLGRLRSKDRVVTKFSALCGKVVQQHYKGKILNCYLNNDGYYIAHISVDKKRTTPQLGRMVLLAFVGQPLDGQECCHNNGNSMDNKIENLRWDSHLENNRDRVTHGTYPIGSLHPMSKLKDDDVISICNSDERGCDLAEKYGVNQSIISDIRKRRIWRHLTDDIEITEIKRWRKCEKMSHEKAREAREMHKAGVSIKSISEKFGVSMSTMGSLINGKTWKTGKSV